MHHGPPNPPPQSRGADRPRRRSPGPPVRRRPAPPARSSITRRRFLAATGIAALAPLSCRRRGDAPLAADPNLLNDVHSQLHPTRVARVAPTPDLAALRRVVRETGERGAAISIGGGRHSMDGQQFGTGTVHLDTRPLDRVLGFDPERGTIEVEAGIQWPELVEATLELQRPGQPQAFRIYSRYYLSTDGQLYWSDTQQLAYYADDYHRDLDRRLGGDVPGSEMITELYVPRAELAGFLGDAAELLRSGAADVVYGTVRLIERDPVSVLAWAREPWACTVLNLHVDHDEAGRERAARTFRHLIDVARRRGGSYFLTYHRWADREQVEACHPRMVEFLRAKLAHDPDERFQSDWYRHYRTMFADRL